jgi:uncharacterized membrane protein YfcA
VDATDLIPLAFLIVIAVVAYRRQHRWGESFRRERWVDWVVGALACASLVAVMELLLWLDAPWPLFGVYILLLAGAMRVYARRRHDRRSLPKCP